MSAGFRYTVSGQPHVCVLTRPLEFEMAPSKRAARYVSQPLDLSEYSVITVGSGRNEVETTIRFERKAQAVLDMLHHAANGTVVTYYPDLSGTGYALWLVGGDDVVGLTPQSGRWMLGDYEARVLRFRDASASGVSLEALFSPWLFRWEAGMFPLGSTFTRTGAAYYIDSDGVLKGAAENVMRISYPLVDGVRTPAYLGEPGRTNLCLQSADFSTTWANTNSSETANATTAPDGTTTADKIVEDSTAAATHGVSQGVAKAASALSYAFSVWAKADEREIVELWLHGTDIGNRAQAAFNLATGEVGFAAETVGTGWTAGVAGMEEYADGWYRCWVTATSNADAAINARALLNDGTGETYSGDGASGLHLWGAQLEQAAAPSSYIPTTTVAVARGADTLYAPFTAVPQEMTAYAKIRPRTTAASRIMQIGAAGVGTDPRFGLIRFSATQYVAFHDNGVESVTSAVTVTPVIGVDDVELRGVLHSDGSVTLGVSVNGGAETVGTQSAAPAGGLKAAWADQRAYIGSGGTTEQTLAGHFADVVAAGVKSMAEMRAL